MEPAPVSWNTFFNSISMTPADTPGGCSTTSTVTQHMPEILSLNHAEHRAEAAGTTPCTADDIWGLGQVLWK